MRIFYLILFIVSVFVILPIGILWLRDALARKKRSPEQVAHDLAERSEKLSNPDFPGMEQFLGVALPREIIEFYNNTFIQMTDIELVDPKNVENIWQLSHFFPAHPSEYVNMWDETKQKFCIAESPFGDPYFVELTEPDLPVYMYYHDGSDTEKVADSLREFVSWMEEKTAS